MNKKQRKEAFDADVARIREQMQEKASKETVIGTASVELIRENPDGSADYVFNFPPEAMAALTRLGIMTAIQAGIDAAKRLNPDVDASDTSPERVDFPDELRHIAEQAGFTFWGDEHWKPKGAIVDWAAADDSDLVRFYRLASDLAYKRAMRDAVGLLKTQHELVKQRHNYYRHAANIIHLEFLEGDDEQN